MVKATLTYCWVKKTVTDWLRKKLGLIDSKFQETITGVLGLFLDYTKEYVPVLSGLLKDSLYIDEHNIGGTIMTDLEYVVYVIFPTEPHEIVPVNAQALFWEGADHPVKRVQHPGTTGNDFFANAYMSGVYEAEDILDKFMDWLVE